MWVWTDELVERLSSDVEDGRDRVPLTAYAVGSEVDLDAFAIEVLSGTRPDRAEKAQTHPSVTNR